MGLRFTSETGVQGIEIFQSKNLEDVPGGLTLDQTDNNFDTGVVVQKGELVIYDEATRLVVIDKLAKVYADTSTTAIQVYKGHCLSVGDILSSGAEGGEAYAITAIDTTTSTVYDTVTVGTALGALTALDVLWLSSASGATAGVFANDPNGILKNDVKPSANDAISVVTRGTVYERRLPGIPGGGVPSDKKTHLTSRILFSQSF